MSASIVLPNLAAAGAGKSGITQTGSGSPTAPPVSVVVHAVDYTRPVKLAVLTGVMRGNGGGLWQFNGLPNRVVEWALLTGTGNLTPLSATTDDSGVAFCRYDAGGYTGLIEVGVTYGN